MRRCRHLGLAGLALAAGCATTQPAGPQGPKVYGHTEGERWFSVPTRCGQGPYEIELTTIGGRWREQIGLQVESRQRVRLTGAILVDDEEVARTTRTLGLHHGEGPENQFCVAAPTDVAQAMQPGAAAGGAIAIPRAPGSAVVDVPSGPAATLIPAERPQYGGSTLVEWTVGRYGVPDLELKGGQRVRIRFWSDLPNDFEGTRIGVVQVVTRPDSDQAYDAWVVERTRWNREEAARLAATRTPAEAAAERKRADEAAAKREEAERAWSAHCRAQPEDGPCLSASERAARNVKQSLRPPPLPRAEPPVPKPSQNAEWRAGYWHWAGTDWIWIAGIGASPRRTCAPSARCTRRSRRPLRPPRRRPSAPAPATVWMPGFWQWSGRGWMWVAGSWQLPPTVNLRWQPPRWMYRGGVFVFVPGGWVSVGRP